MMNVARSVCFPSRLSAPYAVDSLRSRSASSGTFMSLPRPPSLRSMLHHARCEYSLSTEAPSREQLSLANSSWCNMDRKDGGLGKDMKVPLLADLDRKLSTEAW